MNLKYHAIINHQEVDSSNSLTSLRKRMDEYIKLQPWEMYILSKAYETL